MNTGEKIINDLTQLINNYEKMKKMGIEMRTESVWKAVQNILTQE